MRDYSYQIYRSLYSCLEVTDTSVEPQTTITEQTNESNDNNVENKEEQIEPMITSNTEDVNLPGLDLHIEDNEKKRKRTPSPVNRIFLKKKDI